MAIVSLVFIALPASNAVADGPAWVERGPDGAPVRFIWTNPTQPSTVYVSIWPGLLKSADGGHSWIKVGAGLPYGPDLILGTPTDPRVLYADVGGDMYRSADAGATFHRASSGIRPLWLTAMTVDPTTNTTLYAGAGQEWGNFGLYRSTDGGKGWTPLENGLPPHLEVTDVAVDAADGSHVYMVGRDYDADRQSFYRSTDQGESWSKVRTGLDILGFHAVTASLAAPDTLFVMGFTSTWTNVVYKSTDGGSSWRRFAPLPRPIDTFWLFADPYDAGKVYVSSSNGIYATFDDGASWQRLGPRMWFPPVAVGSPGVLYSGSASLIRSTDSGTTWQQVETGTNESSVYDLVVERSHPERVLAATSSGLMRSEDAGGHWTTSSEGLGGRTVADITADPVHPQIMYAGTYAGGRSDRGGVFKSYDGGRRWVRTNSPPAQTSTAFVFDPRDHRTLYVTLWIDDGYQLWRSTDGGDSWERVDWGTRTRRVVAFRFSPSDPSVLYSTFGSLLVSRDGGATWHFIHVASCYEGEADVFGIALDPFDSSDLFVKTYCEGIDLRRTRDGGRSFEYVPVPSEPATVLFDPDVRGTIYVGGFWSGLTRSTDDGVTWTDFDPGMEDTTIEKLVIARPYAYAGTYLSGMYSSEIGEP